MGGNGIRVREGGEKVINLINRMRLLQAPAGYEGCGRYGAALAQEFAQARAG